MAGFLQNKWQHTWVLACLTALVFGLVFSRAVLSIASVAIAVPWFFSPLRKAIPKTIWLALLLLIFPVLYSGFWSNNTAEWWRSVETRIPLFTMMMGISSVRFTTRQWLWVAAAYLVVVAAGCCWSVGIYFSDSSAIQDSYLRAKVLLTPADHDYVRFSWMVALAVPVSVFCMQMVPVSRWKPALVVLCIGFTAYLHLLAAKTGLLCLYTAAALGFIYLWIVRRKTRMALLLFAGALVFATTAYLLLPTLRNRIRYIRYDFSLYSRNGSAPGYNDAARWLSVKAGYGLLQEHPVTGTGFGDLRQAVDEWHTIHHPQSYAYERFLPACEWMVYGAGSGWPGMLLFTGGIILLFRYTTRRALLPVICSSMALIPIIFDDTLEGQLGTAMLAFISFFVQTAPVQTENA